MPSSLRFSGNRTSRSSRRSRSRSRASMGSASDSVSRDPEHSSRDPDHSSGANDAPLRTDYGQQRPHASFFQRIKSSLRGPRSDTYAETSTEPTASPIETIDDTAQLHARPQAPPVGDPVIPCSGLRKRLLQTLLWGQ